MSKQHITKKAFRGMFDGEIYRVPYCELQNVLKFRDADYYTTRSEGWGCDIYVITLPSTERVALTTGYAPFGEGIPYTLYSVFEKVSKQYDRNKTALDKLLYLCIAYARAGHKDVEQKSIEQIMQTLLADG